MPSETLIPHLFRTEFSRITAVLCAHFGIDRLDEAEDIASETFLAAMETWPYKGLPENPAAWLHFVAKNKARNYMKRTRLFTVRIAPELKRSVNDAGQPEPVLAETDIWDSQLQMFFAVCHPSIPAEGQVALALRVLCGFGIEEISNAFMVSPAAISKRLVRAKEILKKGSVTLEVPSHQELQTRLGTVLQTIYLLFNEGYYSESDNTVLREELCLEAMRLNHLLLDSPATCVPDANALMALMCFHASRFPARKDKEGLPVLYDDQDKLLWNQELIGRGSYYFRQASAGNRLSKYHLEGGIAYWHTVQADPAEKWEQVLQLYNRLLQLEYSPVAALNRTLAFSKVYGNAAGITEAEKLQLHQNAYYFILLGALYGTEDREKAVLNYGKALELLKTDTEKRVIRKKISEL